MLVRDLTDKYPIISDQISRPALELVLSELDKVLEANTKGDIVEFGCYIGTTSLFVRRLLNKAGFRTNFHVYDSFEGLPPKKDEDQSAAGVNFKAGELKVSKKQFLREFQKAGLRPPTVHKAWFEDLTKDDIPKNIAFAFLDGDFYDSILKSLQLVWPNLMPGATVCIDDYDRETLPGVKRAVGQFFRTNLPNIVVRHNIAVIKN